MKDARAALEDPRSPGWPLEDDFEAGWNAHREYAAVPKSSLTAAEQRADEQEAKADRWVAKANQANDNEECLEADRDRLQGELDETKLMLRVSEEHSEFLEEANHAYEREVDRLQRDLDEIAQALQLESDENFGRAERLQRENERLRSELREQWESNHSEHCCRDWPHEGECYWPLPSALSGKGRIVQVGSVRVERSESGTVHVWWPGWVIEVKHPITGLEIKADGGASLAGNPIMLGCGSGPHVTIGNEDGKAEERLASLRIGGYSLDELIVIAAGRAPGNV